ncbi:MAG: hypothetical protein IJY36_08505 [Coprobacter sp.]|nr:hypothetical protein [Coprobacter sp.]
MKKFIANTVYRINKRLYYHLRYFAVRKKFAHLKSPQDLSEYLLGEMLKPDFQQYADYTDKVKVRDYVKSIGLDAILPTIYGVWENADDIDFSQLPDSFVLKTNHGCGHHIFCTDKNKLDIPAAKKKLNKLLSKKYSPREPHYQHISPRVYAEEFMHSASNYSLPIDYKIFCTKGQPLGILVCSERNPLSGHCKLNTYDVKWNTTDWLIKEKSAVEIPRPKHLTEMLEIAKKLSAKFDFVRVDLYEINDKIVFGELTFSPHAGFMTCFSDESLKYFVAPILKN